MTLDRLTASVPAHLIAASLTARTVTARVLPWGVIGRTSIGPTRFVRGSVAVPDDLSRVKLLASHRLPGLPDPDVAGYAIAAADTGAGLEIAFHVPPGPAGDRALSDAGQRLRDGVSVEVSNIAGHRADDGALEVHGSYLDAVAQVAVPAFAPARFLTINP